MTVAKISLINSSSVAMFWTVEFEDGTRYNVTSYPYSGKLFPNFRGRRAVLSDEQLGAIRAAIDAHK